MGNYKALKLEKGMYTVAGKSFSQVLEELDPSENYRNTAMDGMDAFQRQLKRLDIKVAGPGSDMLMKFYSTADATALFPEYVSRAIRAGMEENTFLEEIVASVTQIDSQDYRSVTSVPGDEEKELAHVAEGAKLPETRIRTRENLVRLHKRGRLLSASYEAIKFQRLDLFTVTLKQIGAAIAKSQMRDAVDVLVNGDGNNNPAEKVSAASLGTLEYGDLLKLWSKFEPYEMNCMLASPEVILQMAELEEFQNPLTGLNFAGTGRLTTPLGAQLLKSSRVDGNMVIGLDKNCALEMVDCGGVSIEYDKLIERQMESAAVTTITGFSKIFDDAVKVLSI